MEEVRISNRVVVNIQLKKDDCPLQPAIYGVILDCIPKIGDHIFIDCSLSQCRISDLVEWVNLGNEDCKKEYSALEDKLNKIRQEGEGTNEESRKKELRKEYNLSIKNFILLLDDILDIWKYNKVVAVHRRVEVLGCTINVVLAEDVEYGEDFIG